MKKNFVLRTIFALTMAAVLMCGCSKAAQETSSVEETTVVPKAEDAQESTGDIAEENETQDEVAQTTEEETPAEENAEDEETTEDPTGETYNGMPVAQVATTVSNIDEFLDYAETFDEPSLFVYNETEGYVIKMEEGEYHQILKEEKIFINYTENAPYASDSLEAGVGVNVEGNVFEMTPDYSKYDSPHKIIFSVYYTEEFQEGDYFRITCYLDAPVE